MDDPVAGSKQTTISSTTTAKTTSTAITLDSTDRDKGQLISECTFDFLNFPRKQRKNMTKFRPKI